MEPATASELASADTRRDEATLLPTPAALAEAYPASPALTARIGRQRDAIRDILAGRDERLLVIAGPCSLHDPDAALDYAQRLALLSDELADKALLVMRAYVEKPRTTVGWKGLLHDPFLDGSDDMTAGLHVARKLFLDLAGLGLPLGSELLSPLAADYLADTLAWGAIGARTTESQTHRERVSALDFPVGFKNGTAGEVDTAINAIRAASQPQHYIGSDPYGRPARIASPGNPDAHLILRGGRNGSNYDEVSVARASEALVTAGRAPFLLVDCSHANSGKVAARQPEIVAELVARRRAGERVLAGIMLESHIEPGRQNIGPDMAYGVSITDECLGWEATAVTLRQALLA